MITFSAWLSITCGIIAGSVEENFCVCLFVYGIIAILVSGVQGYGSGEDLNIIDIPPQKISPVAF